MIRVVHLGLGEIGKRTLEAILAQPKHAGMKLVAVVDPVFAGQNLTEVMSGRGTKVPSLKIASSVSEILAAAKPSVATMTTGSQTIAVKDTVEQLIKAKLHVVATCEELAFPKLRAARLAGQLDLKARKAGVAIISTGVNPGFAMDAFALACTAPCGVVHSIKVVRTLDACKRRQQLQKKVGAGMSVEAVRALIRKNAIGHVGLGESCAMLAEGLGWKLSAIREKLEPVVATTSISSDYFHVKPGQVRGMLMKATGIVAGKPKIQLELTMALGSPTYDEVTIDGTPSLTIRTTTGFPGEASTVGMVMTSLRTVASLDPGIRTMLDLFRARSIGN